MIPYFAWETIQIGPLTLYVWGLFVGLGLLAGMLTSSFLAKKKGLNVKLLQDSIAVAAIAGIVGARLFYVLFYHPALIWTDFLETFAIWDGGMSIFGGLAGGLLGCIYILKKNKVQILNYIETMVMALPLGLGIGRLGCFLIHDHPGTVTNFFLGIQYPDGLIRHDHGLYLSINGFVLALVFAYLYKKGYKGNYSGFFLIWYGVVRFLLDFWRVNEVIFLGLKPGQYFALAFIAVGIVIMKKFHQNRRQA